MKESKVRGMLSVEKLRQMVSNEEIETVLTVFPDIYGRLLGKRITGHFFIEDVLDHAVHACDYLLACDMEMDPVPGYAFTSWGSGYGDFRLVPDLKTLRVASWLDKTALVLCDIYKEEEDELEDIAPRSILLNQVKQAMNQGYVALGGSELELYLFQDTYEEASQKHFMDLRTFGEFIEDYHILQGTKAESVIGSIRYHLDRSGVPVEFSKGEWGPGQQEINLRFADFLKMADRHCIYKHAAKEIAIQQGCSITFMPKWDERYAGSSMHVHASLWDKSTINSLFPGEDKLGPIHASPIFRWFLGGWIAHVREIFAFYAPYPTSYKRFVTGSFAPTGIAWSYDNRTAAFRIVGEGPSLRIECRAPGADANPYLSFAATLAAGLDGIANKIEPPEIFEGDVYVAEKLPQVPKTLNEAIAELSKSSWARGAFGEDVIEHYLHFFKTEQQKFDEVVTNWERARYFERV
ncbi:glutamine synthetase family protein [bacterium]|nr:glutamine synthetase family protein [bacterium]